MKGQIFLFSADLFQFVHDLVQLLLHDENSCQYHFFDLMVAFVFLSHLGDSIYDPP